MAIDVTPDMWIDPETQTAFGHRQTPREGYLPMVWVPSTEEPMHGYQDAVAESNREALAELEEQFPDHVDERMGRYFFWVDEPEPGVYELPDELAETVGALESYPVLNEERMSEIETDYEDEAWTGWAASDWRRELQDIDFEDEALNEVMEEIFDHMTDAQLWEIYRKAAERANVYVEHTHEGPRFYFDDAAAKFEISDLPEGLLVKMDYLLEDPTRTWPPEARN